MYAVVVGQSLGPDDAESTNRVYGLGGRTNAASPVCLACNFAFVAHRSVSLFDRTTARPQAHGQTWSNWTLDGQTRSESQSSGHWTFGSTSDRSTLDVGRSTRRTRSLGCCDRHREHSCVLRHCAQNGIGNLVITSFHLTLLISPTNRQYSMRSASHELETTDTV